MLKIKIFLNPSADTFNILDENRVYIFQLNKNSLSAFKKLIF